MPRAAFAWVTEKLRGEVSVPLVAVNRINTPDVAEDILSSGQADMVSMARPLLADPEFVKKAEESRADDINTCIACNQACLDHVFKGKRASCLVNPQACYETELVVTPAVRSRKIAVIGGGMAGMSFATTAAERGFHVDLFERKGELGGQFNLARRIPGKEEFNETTRYFSRRVEQTGVNVHLGKEVSAEDLRDYDHIVVATGVKPRMPSIPGIDHPKVVDYMTFIRERKDPGNRVAIIGAGGIGVDVATMITEPEGQTLNDWLADWGIDNNIAHEGGLFPHPNFVAHRQVWLLQRRPGRVGKGPGKTTGWITNVRLRNVAWRHWVVLSTKRLMTRACTSNLKGSGIFCRPIR